MNIRHISFSEDDGNLFQVNDPQLRAEAIRHSVLPRLNILINEAIATVDAVYGINVLEDSIVSMYPKYRQEQPGRNRSQEASPVRLNAFF